MKQSVCGNNCELGKMRANSGEMSNRAGKNCCYYWEGSAREKNGRKLGRTNGTEQQKGRTFAHEHDTNGEDQISTCGASRIYAGY